MKNFQILKISVKSTESWENFALLANKRLDYFLTESKLVPNVLNISQSWKLILLSVKSAKTLTSTVFYLKDNSSGHVISELIEIG